MPEHDFIPVSLEVFDPNCQVCGGKLRDAVHGSTDLERCRNYLRYAIGEARRLQALVNEKVGK